MGFKLLILNPSGQGETAYVDTWPEKLKDEIPDIDVQLTKSVGEAMEVIGEVDAAFGNIVPELFERATNLKWIACPQAGPQAGYYHQALIDSNVVVTNTREIYDDHISAHIMSFILAFARGLHVYIPRQLKRQWIPGIPDYPSSRRHSVDHRGGRHWRRNSPTLCRVWHDRHRGRPPNRRTTPRGEGTSPARSTERPAS